MHTRIFVCLIILSFSCTQQVGIDYPVWSDDDRNHLIAEFKSTQKILHELIEGLNEDQWTYKMDSASWSISYIIEHLQLQEDMHYREVRIVAMQPPQPEYALKTIGNDQKVNAYETDQTKGIADWNVTPLGRWQSKDQSIQAFDRSRSYMIELVTNMQANLRQQITFRNVADENDFRRVRNLHQILLTTIAHTKRHIHQINSILALPEFPEN